MTAILTLAAVFVAIILWDLHALCKEMRNEQDAREQFWREFDADPEAPGSGEGEAR